MLARVAHARTRTGLAGAIVAAIALLLVGCGTTAAPGQQALPTNVVTTPAVPPVPAKVYRPASIEIPAIGAESTLVPLGLNPDGSHAVPPVSQPRQAGWYDGMAAPGEPGPAIVLGHVDGHGQRGVFFALGKLAPGAEVHIADRSGEVLVFVVSRVTSYCKHVADTLAKPALCTGPVFDREGRAEIYAPTAGSTLRLITCGGDLDRAARSYRSNIVVFAELKV